MESERPIQFLDKPAIPVDDRLKELGDALLPFIEETASLSAEELARLLLVGTMEHSSTPGNTRFLSFLWGYAAEPQNSVGLAALKQIHFENNLDSLIDYEKGFEAPIYFIFPLLECIRRHYGSEKVFLLGGQHRAKIYVRPPVPGP